MDSRWMDKLVHPDNGGLFSELSSHDETQRKLKCILVSERSQSWRPHTIMDPAVRHSRKDKTIEIAKKRK